MNNEKVLAAERSVTGTGHHHALVVIITAAILLKLFLFVFAAIHAPGSKFSPDTDAYLKTADMLYSHGVFAQPDADGLLQYEVLRTPGYPAFLALLNHFMKIPLGGVVLLQVLLTVLIGWIAYRTAIQIDEKIGILSAVIVLYDLPSTIASLRILTETLFSLWIALFLFSFIRYLKKGELRSLILSALMLALATYVRPISYYLAGALAFFIVYVNRPGNFRKAFTHALIFFAIAYCLLGIWQIRNYCCCREISFASIARDNFGKTGLFAVASRNQHSFWSAAARAVYIAALSFLQFMTKPGLLKYFNSHALFVTGKILILPWMVFWMTGFFIGCSKIGRNVYFQFLLFVFLYFALATICNLTLITGERFRVPVVPCIAMISAYGWLILLPAIKKSRFAWVLDWRRYVPGAKMDGRG